MDLDDLDKPTTITPVVSGLAKVHQIRDRVMEKAASVVEGSLGFADLTPEDIASETTTERWKAKHGADADRMFALAKMGLLTASQAPNGAKMASATLNGMMKAYASEKQAPQTFNAVIIQMPSAAPPMEEVIVTVKE